MRRSVRLRQQRAKEIVEPLREVTARAEQENRNLNAAEHRQYERLERDYVTLTQKIQQAEEDEDREARDSRVIGSASDDGTAVDRPTVRMPQRGGSRSAALTRDQSFAQHVRDAGHHVEGDRALGLGKMLRGMALGDWRGADLERRALFESNPASAGTLVPAPMAANVIDLARSKTRIMRAGALTVPMDSSTLKIARQTGDPDLAWHAEGDQINDSGLEFDSVTLRAHTLPVQVKFSWEIFEDVDDLDSIVEQAISKAIAVELDRVALRGSGVDPEPKGLLNQTGVTKIDVGTDGAPATWDTLVDGVAAVRGNNFEPNAAILAERTQRDLGTQRENADGTGQYLAAPPYLEGIERLGTTGIPTDLTHGVASDASEIYVGQWSELLIGMRTSFAVQMLDQPYADTGEFAISCRTRVDVAPAHGGAFALLNGITPRG